MIFFEKYPVVQKPFSTEMSQSKLSWNIDTSPPHGNDRRITLVSTDLIFGENENVFFYPILDVEHYLCALL